ncbi:MAG: DUF3810 domain-containing protein [Lachnospiraceae bacterium]|nr:DUF3810 domain-containing protein [Lachnospiraceae bacterium]
MKKYYFSLLTICILAIANLVAAWTVTGYSDFYVEKIFPAFLKTYGALTGKLSFSIGEILLYAFVVYVILSLLLYLVRLIFKLCKKKVLSNAVKVNTRVLCFLITLVVVLQINNCFVMYHTSRLLDDCAMNEYQPTREDLIALQRALAESANDLYLTFERDEKGEIINVGDQADKAVMAMKNLSKLSEEKAIEEGPNADFYKKLGRLCGNYSRPKPFKSSKFFSQQGILGYYFPFSLEANYNQMMYIVNYPSTFCHELSHLKGFIREDEANFVSYLACMNSEDDFMRYSAMLSLLSYMYEKMDEDPSLKAEYAGIYPRVYKDMAFLTKEAWEKVEESAIISTETVNKASQEFLEANLTLNGVEEGIISYNGVVELALKFYFGER